MGKPRRGKLRREPRARESGIVYARWYGLSKPPIVLNKLGRLVNSWIDERGHIAEWSIRLGQLIEIDNNGDYIRKTVDDVKRILFAYGVHDVSHNRGGREYAPTGADGKRALPKLVQAYVDGVKDGTVRTMDLEQWLYGPSYHPYARYATYMDLCPDLANDPCWKPSRKWREKLRIANTPIGRQRRLIESKMDEYARLPGNEQSPDCYGYWREREKLLDQWVAGYKRELGKCTGVFDKKRVDTFIQSACPSTITLDLYDIPSIGTSVDYPTYLYYLWEQINTTGPKPIIQIRAGYVLTPPCI